MYTISLINDNILYVFTATLRFVNYPTNTTALAESRLELSCAVDGHDSINVRVNWQLLQRDTKQKNLQRTGRNYRIVRDGPFREVAHLRFTRLFVSDSGYYRCVARSNGQIIQTDYFYLTIQGIILLLYHTIM